jgi:dihydropteroate synthase
MHSNSESLQYTNKSLHFKVNKLKIDQPIIMGILNVTPDSFFDGRNDIREEDIVQKVNAMEYDGAQIIDIGGYSTRPGAAAVSETEELKRVLPIVQLIQANFKGLEISIDTFRSSVAKKCVEAGATLINDISGGSLDKNMFSCVADLKVPYILMHLQGSPQTMQDHPTYTNVVEEIKQYFEEKINQLNQLGVNDIILDPGFGFGKTVEHNYEILSNLDAFKTFGLPILAGVSRKSMINKVLNTTPEEALNGTTVLNTIALTKGAQILRVHDVREANECVKLQAKISR